MSCVVAMLMVLPRLDSEAELPGMREEPLHLQATAPLVFEGRGDDFNGAAFPVML